MTKILVSSCLLGHKVRYNARDRAPADARFDQLRAEHELIPFCPEVGGGLPTPRPAAEIRSGDGNDVMSGAARVVDINGKDVSAAFVLGAEQALKRCQTEGIRHALLTEGSPSCGSGFIYDGSFGGVKKSGQGVTAAVLTRHGIEVFNEHQLEALLARLD